MMADKRPVLWSAEALNDIDHLWDYYADLAGRITADKVLRGIASVVTTIEAFPRAGRSRDEVRAGLRSLAADPHVVFYRLAREQPEIVRVIDGRQDIGEIFPVDLIGG
jgi:toxin ParE1/3/4